MYLFIDTETNGIPKSWEPEASSVENWPRVVQVAYLLCDNDATIAHQAQHLIKPQGWTILPSATAVHGITQEQADRDGEPIQGVLEELAEYVLQADVLVAHNIEFDQAVLGAEYCRQGWKDILAPVPTCCTMHSTRDWCNLPGGRNNKPKLPKLSELYNRIFNTDFSGQHQAFHDVLATYKIFWALHRQGFPWGEYIGRARI